MSSAEGGGPAPTDGQRQPEAGEEAAAPADAGQFQRFPAYKQQVAEACGGQMLLFYSLVCSGINLLPEKESKTAKAPKIPRLQRKRGTPSRCPPALRKFCFPANVTEIITEVFLVL